MIISIHRCGGFAGIDQPLGQADVDRLPAEQAKRAKARLDDFLTAQAQDVSPVGADQFRLEVRLRSADQAPRTYAITDDAEGPRPATRALRALAEALAIPLE